LVRGYPPRQTRDLRLKRRAAAQIFLLLFSRKRAGRRPFSAILRVHTAKSGQVATMLGRQPHRVLASVMRCASLRMQASSIWTVADNVRAQRPIGSGQLQYMLSAGKAWDETTGVLACLLRTFRVAGSSEPPLHRHTPLRISDAFSDTSSFQRLLVFAPNGD
jgi:hypothetical protein